jgi:hypothetical protein
MAFNQVNSLEYNEIKLQIKNYLKGQSEFSDYDFEGSSLTVLLDVLAYNTYYTAMNANLIVNENFLETAVLRENVVKLARMIGYTPKSARSSSMPVNVAVQTAFPYPKTVTISRGIVLNFTGPDNDNFVFSTNSDQSVSVDSLTGVATFSNLNLYEGVFLTDTFVRDTSERQRFILTNENIDTTTLRVEVTSGTVTESYLKATDITKIDNNTKVYFLEESEYGRPEVLFGDNILGKALLDGDVISVTYTTSSGAGANGLTSFDFIGTVRDNNSNTITSGITTTLVTNPDGGAVQESTESIKFSAPKFYSAFGRAVSTRDYEVLLPQIYPNIQSISAYGGEEADPPEYGKVFLAIKPKNADKLSLAEKNNILKKLREYSVAAVEPKIIDPSVLYIDITSFVYFNPNLTRRTQADLKNIVIAAFNILNSGSEFNKFGGKFKYSKLQKIIDDSDPSFTSNITKIMMRKNVPVTLNARVNYKVCYGNAIFSSTDRPSVTTTGFNIAGDAVNTYYLQDDGRGSLQLFYVKDTGEKEFIDGLWGSVDYVLGEVVINDVIIRDTPYVINQIRINAVPKSNDLISLRETYLTIGIDNTVVNVVEDVISSGSNISGTGVTLESSYN